MSWGEVSDMPGKRELVKEKTASSSKLWLIPTVAVVALAGGFAAFGAAAATSDVIGPNTFVDDTEVSGLTRAEAVQTLTPALERLRAQSGVHVMLDGQELTFLTYEELGAEFDANAIAQEAYERSHSGNAVADGWQQLTAALGKRTDIKPETVDGWQENAAEKLADMTELTASDFSYEIGEDVLTLNKERDGRNVDRTTLQTRLNDAQPDDTGARSVDLPYTVIAAQQGDLNKLNELLGGEMANARYDAETDTIIPERPALNFDVSQAQMLLDAAAPGSRVSVPATAETPEVTAEELEQVLFRDVLGTYTTRVGGAAGRKANVKLTAQRVNGYVMNSGEEFNYYELTGPFTKANGYQSAPGYLQGKTVEMDGGGACQCSSTTYAAALLANMEIVARTAHGFASDYIGLGMDATVSGGGPEFIFRNNTPYPIKIETIYSDNHRLTVNILGTKTDDTYVKIRTEVLSTTPYEELTVESPDLAPGETKVDQTPYTGYVVNTYRQIYDGNNHLISETFEARSKYNKRDRITLVGPGTLTEPNAPASGTTTPGGQTQPGTTGDSGEQTTQPGTSEAPPAPYDMPSGPDLVPIEEQLEQLGEENTGEGAGA